MNQIQHFTASILVYKSDLSEKFSENLIRVVSNNLRNICIKKINVISSSNLSYLIEISLKQFDYVFLVVDSDNHSSLITINNSLCVVFNQNVSQNKLININSTSIPVLEHFKVLTSSTLSKNVYALYMQGLFIISCCDKNFELLMANVVQPHLSKRTRGESFKRILYFNSQVDMNTVLRYLFDGNINVKAEAEEGINSSRLIISSKNLRNLMLIEKDLKNYFSNIIMEIEQGAKIDDLVYQYNYDYVKNSIECIEKCFKMYGPKNVLLSFNGGKDCTVLLHMTLAVLKRHYSAEKIKLLCLYIQYVDPFEELNDFVDQCQQYYDLDVVVLKKNAKESLDYILKEKPYLKACLMGTRRTDPFANHLQQFQMTDPDWPQIMRVNPILNWHYSEVWDYLLDLNVPYCSLYDKGYTSIGSSSNTKPNPSLYFYNELKDTYHYLPAYKLLDASKERNGRVL